MSDAPDTRRSVYLLLTAVAVAIAAAKVVGAENVYEPSRYSPPPSGGYSAEPARSAAELARGTARPDADVQFERQVALGDDSRARRRAEPTSSASGSTDPDRSRKKFTDTGIVAEPAYRSPRHRDEPGDEGVLLEQAAAHGDDAGAANTGC